jgi:hypothetical protein
MLEGVTWRVMEAASWPIANVDRDWLEVPREGPYGSAVPT